MTEPNASVGQAEADSTGTTAAAPSGSQGQSVTQGQTTVSGPAQGSNEESFFDPTSIQDKPELLAAYKQMQAAYTKKSQSIKQHQTKLDQYDQFMRDPLGSAQQILSQLGYQVVQRDPAKQETSNSWTPQSWADVEAMIEKKAEEIATKRTRGLQGEVVSLKQQSMEARLDRDYPDWRTYEDVMLDNLKEHPTLVNDPDTLYRLSVPAKVIEERAMSAAMKKLKAGTENAQVSGGSAAVKPNGTKPGGKLSLNEAAEFARAELAKRGVHRPAG